MSDAELATLAEGTKQYEQDPLFRELTWRTQRSAGTTVNGLAGSQAPLKGFENRVPRNGPREQLLIDPSGGV